MLTDIMSLCDPDFDALIKLLVQRRYDKINHKTFAALRKLMQDAEHILASSSPQPLNSAQSPSSAAATITRSAFGSPDISTQDQVHTPASSTSTASTLDHMPDTGRKRKRKHTTGSITTSADLSRNAEIDLLMTEFPDDNYNKALKTNMFSTDVIGESILLQNPTINEASNSSGGDEFRRLWITYQCALGIKQCYFRYFLVRIVQSLLARLFPPQSVTTGLIDNLTAKTPAERDTFQNKLKGALKIGRKWNKISELCEKQGLGAILVVPRR